MLPIIDSHCHIDFTDFDSDRERVLAHCQQLGVTNIIVPGVTRSSWQKLLDVCQDPMLHPAFGLHPMFMQQHQAQDILALDEAIVEYQPVAIGEIGLDFYDSNSDKAAQISLFEQQIKLAEKHQLPVILHVRKAHDEVLKVLRKAAVKGGIVHAFSGSEQQAEQYLNLGFKLGIGGALTYERAKKLHRLFQSLPLDAIVLETDAPDMPLMGKQGQRNSPEFLPLVLSKLAALRNETEQAVAAATSYNCKQLFCLN